MWLLIDADQNPATGWQGFDFIVNRNIENPNETWLEQNEGGWTWKKIARLPCRAAGRELHLSIPRAALALRKTEISLDFQWADNLQHPGDPMDLYVSGDVAPEGRFRYRYSAR